MLRGAIIAALALATPAQAELTRADLEKAWDANAREVYVACYLLTQNASVAEENKDFRARSIVCSMLGLKAATFHNGPTVAADVSETFHSCMPTTPDFTDDPSRAMAYAYLAYFEKHAAVIGSASGEKAFLHAMAQKWPCS
ncbi:hypothetical protein [Sphingorhabdus sp.]|jgi:hypothetical protein|uniref:hypothetical protein n=1 Tax=Sphingorhabdus sp. TaxID=1902408 RepID=UPI002C136808|nr:hypothetical protein [Sphingorhabdus sp.]HMT42204.1 hypothetical protein [Sphingorhabdus sp.]